VNVSAEEMELGYYACELIITTNAPNAANYIIPLSMEVVEAFLNAPQNVNISQNGSQVTIQWEAVTGAAGYKIYVANSPEETFNYLTTVSTNSFSHAVPQGKMFYKIVAIN
jgi:fibronectin type 3 domain-containing protein